jgi:hypothetical protein
MALSNMQVFNQYYQPAIIETLGQMIDKFNEASRGAIVLTPQGFDGDFLQRSFFTALHSARRRVDRYASNTAVNPTNLAQQKDSAVKVAGGFGPILFEPSQMGWLNKPTGEAIALISQNFAEAMLQDQLNTAIAALVAAISNQSAAKYDGLAVSPDLGISQVTLNRSHALFGDHSSSLVAQVMTGSVAHKLVGQNLTNSSNLFQAGNVTVLDILGKAVVVTDAPALYESVSPGADKEKVLSLVEGAAIVFDNNDMVTNIETSNGKERIETTFQADYTFGLALKGYTWDTGNGGKSPTDAELATGSNWDKTASDIKNTAGVVAIGSADVA